MKHNDFDLDESIMATDLANVFHVYEDENLGNFYLTYNINRTLAITGLDNVSKALVEDYTVKLGDTWTTIAYSRYSDTRLWWLVCKVNGIVDPTEQPTTGQKIKLLKDEVVKGILEEIKVN